jgi:hypothetical protein
LGDGGGTATDPMTKTLSDQQNYVTQSYGLRNFCSDYNELFHKGFVCFAIKGAHAGKSDRTGRPEQGTYTLVPIYWLNQFLESMYEKAKKEFRSKVLSLISENDKYAFLFPKIVKYMTTSGGTFYDQLNTRRPFGKNRENRGGFGGKGGNDDDDEDGDDYSDDGSDSEPGSKSDIESEDNYYGRNDSGDKGRNSDRYYSRRSDSNDLENSIWESLDEEWLQFVSDYLPNEDFFFIETNLDTHWTKSVTPSFCKPDDNGNCGITNARPWKYAKNGNGLIIFGHEDEKAKYPNQFDDIIEKQRISSNTSDQSSRDGNNYMFDNIYAPQQPSYLGARRRAEEGSSSAPLPYSFQSDRKYTIFQNTLNLRHKSQFSSNTKSTGRDPSLSVLNLFEHAKSNRLAVNSLVDELRSYIRKQIEQPSDDLLGNKPSAISFLYRGGFFNNFSYIGCVNTMMDDTTELHSYGISYTKHQIAKVTAQGEQKMYNLWGGNIQKFSKLYFVVRRKLPNKVLPRLGTNNVWDVVNNGAIMKGAGYHSMDLAFCDACGDGGNVGKLSKRGWFNYCAFEIDAKTWGLSDPNIEDLTYVDVHGKKAIAETIYVGKMKYEYVNEAYPWNMRDMALGRPNRDGVIPTHKMCKRSTANLPIIRVLQKT